MPGQPQTAPPQSADPIQNNRTFSIAPMLDWTDRHCRYFHRLLTHHSLLYTEMITTGALIHGDTQRFLAFNPQEHPIACQLGGSNPKDLAKASKLVEDYGYDEVNLNVGCPSDRVQNGAFGACLMANPDLVAECVSAMRNQVNIPVTVKHRIGIDDQDSYDFLVRFVSTVADAGCHVFIVHARKAILQGLSPKENREIPPLMYERVYQLKKDFPHLQIIINGGLKTLDQCQQALNHVDGVMVGREAYQNPFWLSQIDHLFFDEKPNPLNRFETMERLVPYIESMVLQDIPVHRVIRHVLGLFHGQPGGKLFRRYLSENLYKRPMDIDVVIEALNLCQSALDRRSNSNQVSPNQTNIDQVDSGQ